MPKPKADETVINEPDLNFKAILAEYSKLCRERQIEVNTVVRNALLTTLDDSPHVGKQLLLDFSTNGTNGEDNQNTFSSKNLQVLCEALMTRQECEPQASESEAKSKNQTVKSKSSMANESKKAVITNESSKKAATQDNVKGAVELESCKPPSALGKNIKDIRIWTGNCAGEYGMLALAKILGSNEIPIIYLELINCQLGVQECRILGNFLCAGMNSTLISLVLDYNNLIGCKGLRNLCRGLASHVALRRLSLRYCSVGEEGTKALSKVLHSPTCKYQSLKLCGNQINGFAFNALQSGLAANKSLTQLWLTENRISHLDAEYLGKFASSLAEHPTITELDLRFNPMGDVGASALLKLSKESKPLLVTLLVDQEICEHLYNQLYRQVVVQQKKKKKPKSSNK